MLLDAPRVAPADFFVEAAPVALLAVGGLLLTVHPPLDLVQLDLQNVVLVQAALLSAGQWHEESERPARQDPQKADEGEDRAGRNGDAVTGLALRHEVEPFAFEFDGVADDFGKEFVLPVHPFPCQAGPVGHLRAGRVGQVHVDELLLLTLGL